MSSVLSALEEGANGLDTHPSTAAAAVVEKVEQDTTDSEDIHDVMGFLLPPGTVPVEASQFAMAYNSKVLNGWVKQPSACCGAASVAGAYNALRAHHRSHGSALNHIDVLNVYRSMFVDIIEKKKATFERRFGGSVDELLVALERELIGLGREIGASAKKNGATKKFVIHALKILARAYVTSGEGLPGPPVNDENEASARNLTAEPRPTPMQLLVELFTADGVVLHGAGADEDDIALCKDIVGEVECNQDQDGGGESEVRAIWQLNANGITAVTSSPLL
jgi:hypothetical protein